VRCQDIAVSECQLINPLVRGIELLDCQRCRITGNNVVDRRPVPTMQEAIRIRGKSRHNLVANNIVGNLRGKPGRSIDVMPAGASEVRGNLEATEA
jgi:hypothetical protein